MVQWRLVAVFQPRLDRLFDPLWFSYRPCRGPHRTVATAMRLCAAWSGRVWVFADVGGAFTDVPFSRSLGVLRRHLPDDRQLGFVELVSRSPVCT